MPRSKGQITVINRENPNLNEHGSHFALFTINEAGDLEVRLRGKRVRQFRVIGLTSEQSWLKILPPTLRLVKPEEVGALTDAPMITDGQYVWWFDDYQTRDEFAELKRYKVVTLKCGGTLSE